MYNLLKYSDNYADSGSLWQFKRDEQNMADAGNPDNVTTADSSSFKYKSSLLGAPNATGVLENAKIVVPLKYFSNFFRSLEMSLINCKIHFELNWTKICVMSSVPGVTAFQITSTKLFVPIVTLSTKDNVNLTKQLNEGFKRSVDLNEYKSKTETKNLDDNFVTSFPLDTFNQGVNRLFVLAFNKTDGNANQVDITNYNVLIDGRNFYDQPVSDPIRIYDEIRTIATGQGNNYTTGCLLDYQYFLNQYQLIAVNLSTQKEVDADPRSIQQIELYGMLKTDSQVCTVLEKSKLSSMKEQQKCCKTYKWLNATQ